MMADLKRSRATSAAQRQPPAAQTRSRLRVAALLAALAAVGVILFSVPGMLSNALLAIVVAYVLNPAVARLERRGYSRAVAILVLYAVLGVGCAVIGSVAAPAVVQQAMELKAALPRLQDAVERSIGEWRWSIADRFPWMADLDLGLQSLSFSEIAGPILAGSFSVASSVLLILVLVPLTAFFLLKDAAMFQRSMLQMVPNRYFEPSLALIHRINTQLGSFIRAKLAQSVVVGLLLWIGLSAVSIDFAALLAAFAAVMNLIPYIGPLIGAVPGILVAVFVMDTPDAAWFGSAVYFVAQVVDMVFIVPLVVARIVDLHPLTVILTIIAGGKVLGVMGMLIALPMVCMLKSAYLEIDAGFLTLRR
ncbi:MAG: AI-2E family transporter [Candidatus Schekmanbacteria bacterium]|nr:AI-2E family transporter [Candidatus Schekmanbacteria bacterium]